MYFPISLSIDKKVLETPLFFAYGQRSANFVNNLSERFGFLKKLPRQKFKFIILVILVILVILAVGAFMLFKGNGDDSQSANDAAFVTDGQKAAVNKKFAVPIRNRDGGPSGSDLIVNATTFERTDRVLYKGKPLVARNSKDFLVINIEVENSTNNRLTIRPVDFFRLVDEGGKSYAADIQTDPVKVEAQSNKRTRVIYIISEEQKNLKFLIGEIKGNRETVEVAI